MTAAVVGIVLLLALLLAYNDLQVEVKLNGQGEVTQEYGEAYSDPGARAWVTGRLFPQTPRGLLLREEKPEIKNVGTYTVTYRAEYPLLFWKLTGTAQRTVHIVDTKPPEITLMEDPRGFTLPGQTYQEEGFQAYDNYDGDITYLVERTATEDAVTYRVKDSSGNETVVTRPIEYGDPFPPEILLLGEQTVTQYAGKPFEDPGCAVTDNADGDITDRVQVLGQVDVYKSGTYTLTYTVTDSYGNTAQASRTVNILPCAQPDDPVSTGKVIYLTFDDGPGPYTEELLDLLAKYNVKVTFFVMATKYTDLLTRMAEEGHTVAIHSTTHNYNRIYSSEEAFFNDLSYIRNLITEKTGIAPKLLRFPGGTSNTVSKFNPGIMTRLLYAVQNMGYRCYDWNVDSGDAVGVNTAEGVYQRVISGVAKRKVAVVLQHDVKGYSVEAVERILIWGMENGYIFLPLDETSPPCRHGARN